MSDDWEEALRKAGGEYGAATGRPRRIGPFDAVASRYGLKCQNADKIALTKMDVLSSMKEIPVITGYKRDGVIVTDFDPMDELDSYTSVVEMLPGWKCDIRGIKRYEDLPENCRRYIEFIEEKIGYPITMVSNGPGRDEIIYR